MKFSSSWIQFHIDKSLPKIEKVAETLSVQSLEVEEVVENSAGGYLLEVKVLPHRQHDCLSHRGIAREIALLLHLKTKELDIPEYKIGKVVAPTVVVEDALRCPRYIGVRINKVKVTKSPAWLKERLESIGQRSISTIIDITNFVMNDIGQPMHAFDADKVRGAISVRKAHKGETMVTLDGKPLVLKGTETVIADEEGVLALAGVKGGTKALVDESTKNIILESANFNGTYTRKTSEIHGIRTDASKRFEGGITSELAQEAMQYAVYLIQEMNASSVASELSDVYPKKEVLYKVGVTEKEVNALLGTTYTETEISKVLRKNRMLVEVLENPRDVLFAKAKMCTDIEYKRGASVLYDMPHKADCSSLISWLYVQAGFSIPRISVDQFVYGEPIAQKDLLPGDLVFTNTGQLIHENGIHYETKEWLPGTKVAHGIDHVGMYLGEGKILHTSSQRKFSGIEDLATSPQFQKELYYRRIIVDEGPRFLVTIPYDRLDIRIKQDLIEEVGRVLGYDAIVPVLPDLGLQKGLPHKRLFYEMKIKNILLTKGYSEICTYTFGDTGEVEIIKGLASDKEKLRTNLSSGVLGALSMNLHNAPLLGVDTLRVFEFGNVFSSLEERRHLSLAVDDGKKKSNFSEEVEFVLTTIKSELGLSKIEYECPSTKPFCVEIDFDTLIASLPEPHHYEPLAQATSLSTYTSVSPYPFIARDIACFTPPYTSWEDVHALLVQVRSPYVVRIHCFDTFTKEVEIDGEKKKKVSYAFRVVFQAKNRTLTDGEANEVADQMYELLKKKGYEIR